MKMSSSRISARGILLVLVLSVTGRCFSQGKQRDLCDLPHEQQGRGFAGPLNADAYDVLATIGRVVPFQTHTIQLFPSSSALVKQMGGAAARLCGQYSNERWIFFDQTYIDSIKPKGGKSDLPRYFVLAHEAAHHINGDTLVGNTWSKDQELAADYSAAVWLARLGVTEEELLRTFDALGLPTTPVNGYPTYAERRTKVIQGYMTNVAPSINGSAPDTVTPTPLPNWIEASWNFEVKNKHVTLTGESLHCPATMDQSLDIFKSQKSLIFKFEQSIYTKDVSDLETNVHCSMLGDDKGWDVSMPLDVSVQDQKSLSFTASTEACHGRCKIPGRRSRLTGTIHRLSDDQIEVDFLGSFQGPFILNLGQ
jgi:hypothetical protein